MRPCQGPGVSTNSRGTTRAQRECESRFPLRRGPGRELRKKVKTLYITDIPPPTPVEAKGSKHCWRSSANTARNASQTLGYTNTNMARCYAKISETNISREMPRVFVLWLYLIEILHQTTTDASFVFSCRRLYLIEILHQTTTI